MGIKQEMENNTQIFGDCGHEKERMDYHEHMDFWTESQSRGLWELILDGHNACANAAAATKQHALFCTCPGIQELAFFSRYTYPRFFSILMYMFPLGIPESFYHTLLFEESRVGEKEFEILFRVDRGFEVRVVLLTSAFRNNDDIAGRPWGVAFSDSGYYIFDTCSR